MIITIAVIALIAVMSLAISLAGCFGILAWIEKHPDGLVSRLWNTGAVGQSIYFITFGITLIITFILKGD